MSRTTSPLPIFFRPLPSFKLNVTPTNDYIFTLPLRSIGTYNFTVNWGDGSAENIITTYDSINRIHTYANATPREITITGQCTVLDFLTPYPYWEENHYYSAGDEVELNGGGGLLYVMGDFKCILAHTASWDNIPLYGPEWETYWVEIDLSKYMVTGIGTIVGDIGLTKLRFLCCNNLTTVDTSMSNLKSLTTVQGMFVRCNLTSIPAGIFDGSIGITDFSYMFVGNYSFNSIPTDLFRYNINVTNFSYVFNSCSMLTSIPTDLFRYNTKVTTFESAFTNISTLTSMPSDLFDYNLLVTNFNGTFENDMNLDGNAPELWLRDPEPSGINCFTYCEALDNYASIPNDWRGL